MGSMTATKDTRITYGASCTWWDSIDKIGLRESGGHRLPCCPHCKGVLFEVESETIWFDSADKYEANGHPGYRAMLEWARGKCFTNFGKMQTAYKAEQV